MDAPASSSPIQFNGILARRIALRLKEFFFKNTYQLRALMLLNFAHPESHNDRKQRRSNLSIKLVPVHSIRLFYTQCSATF